ncbi:MAG TPA: hypothetical protein DCY13_09245, partial [Verrucomicrobiales bacterium]|nr:hypothetical protein [Verrucomicrobiales bacterium]
MKTRLELLRTVLWLRWRLSRNQLRRTGVFAQILLVLVVILALGGVFGAGATGLLLGLVVFPEVGVEKVMYVIDGVMVGFLFMWIIGLVVDVQRSEAVDLQRLLHLPVTLKDAFLVNFAASHITVSLGLAVPAVFGLALGLALATDLRWLLLVPLFLAFVFLVSTWTYCVRGWLVQLMVNPRRRRAIIILLTAAIVVLAQAPNLFFNVYLRRSVGNREEAAQVWKEQLEVIERAHLYVPPLWVGWGTVQATRGVWWPALGAMALFGAGGVLGFRRAYQSTLRYYRGQERRRKSSERKPAASSERADRPSRREFIERRLPFVSSEVSVATLAFWRSMQRAPEMKMALLTPLLMLGIFGVMLYSRDFGEGPRRFGPLIAISLTAFALSGLTGILFNQFGSDRNGFRALVLSPV